MAIAVKRTSFRKGTDNPFARAAGRTSGKRAAAPPVQAGSAMAPTPQGGMQPPPAIGKVAKLKAPR